MSSNPPENVPPKPSQPGAPSETGPASQRPDPTPAPAQPPPQLQPGLQLFPQLLLASALRGSPIGIGGPIPIPVPVSQPVAQTQQVVQLWQGQYPPPDAVEHYEKVLPGSFDRMIAMAERLQAAQIDESRRVHDYTHADTKRGQLLGAGAAALAMICALGAVALGNAWVAAAFISVPVMGVAKVLVESARKPSTTELLAAASGPQVAAAPIPPPSPPAPAAAPSPPGSGPPPAPAY